MTRPSLRSTVVWSSAIVVLVGWMAETKLHAQTRRIPPMPEPSTVLMLALGGGAIAARKLVRRRRDKR
jgi:PEP-CTERM motif-containing protein